MNHLGTLTKSGLTAFLLFFAQIVYANPLVQRFSIDHEENLGVEVTLSEDGRSLKVDYFGDLKDITPSSRRTIDYLKTSISFNVNGHIIKGADIPQSIHESSTHPHPEWKLSAQ